MQFQHCIVSLGGQVYFTSGPMYFNQKSVGGRYTLQWDLLWNAESPHSTAVLEVTHSLVGPSFQLWLLHFAHVCM